MQSKQRRASRLTTSSVKASRLTFERNLWSREFTLVAGVDEAGRAVGRAGRGGGIVASGILA